MSVRKCGYVVSGQHGSDAVCEEISRILYYVWATNIFRRAKFSVVSYLNVDTWPKLPRINPQVKFINNIGCDAEKYK